MTAVAAIPAFADLRVDLGRSCAVCSEVQLAIISPGVGPHAAQLRCAICGSHRQWFPRAAVDFLEQIISTAGTPDVPVLFHDRVLKIGEHIMTTPTKYDNTNSGALCRDEQKAKETDRDYGGTLNVNGTEYWVSGWQRQAKSGKKYLALKLKPKDAVAA
jgi:hypothetical protein